MLVLGVMGEPSPIRANPFDISADWKSGWYHDAAAALIEDGKVICAIEEERLNRRKHSGKFPANAIRFCLNQSGHEFEDIDFIAYGEEGGVGTHRDPLISVERIASVLEHELGHPALASKIRLVEHHIGHAVSAFYPSGYSEALVMTADGFGDDASGYVMTASGGKLTPVDRFSVENSLGIFYQSPLGFLGFGRSDEYKVMGLAPYGDPARFMSFFKEQYRLLPEGKFEVHNAGLSERLATLGPPRKPNDPLEEFHMDVAAALQAALEDLYFHILRHHQATTGLRNLCLSGGTAQNCTVNGKLLHSELFDNVFVQPASYDAGIPIGAALHVWQQESGGSSKPAKLEHVYWGSPVGDSSEIEAELERWRDFISFTRVDDVCKRAAEQIEAGSVIGWVQDRSEFGPRALGNRSILADPRPAENKDIVNSMVKKREAFRPFAPAVTAEAAAEYFDVKEGGDFGYMNFIVNVKKEQQKLLGAITHVDGTARVQTVSKTANERFWRLLDAFGKRTGIPILLNTSFNNNAEPIVDSVFDAVVCFLTTGLHKLVVGDYVIDKKQLAPDAYLHLSAIIPIDAAIIRAYERLPFQRGRAFNALVTARPQLELAPLSKVVYHVLTAEQRDKSVNELVAGMDLDAAARQAVGQELFDLWGQRKVILHPL